MSSSSLKIILFPFFCFRSITSTVQYSLAFSKALKGDFLKKKKKSCRIKLRPILIQIKNLLPEKKRIVKKKRTKSNSFYVVVDLQKKEFNNRKYFVGNEFQKKKSSEDY